MKTTQTVNVSVNSTYKVSMYDWREKTRFEVYENEKDSVEIQDIDTDEMLTAVSYFVRNLARRDDLSDLQSRILHDIKNDLNDALKSKESEATTNA